MGILINVAITDISLRMVELRYQDIGQGPCTCKIIKDIDNNIDTGLKYLYVAGGWERI